MILGLSLFLPEAVALLRGRAAYAVFGPLLIDHC